MRICVFWWVVIGLDRGVVGLRVLSVGVALGLEDIVGVVGEGVRTRFLY